MDPWSPENLFVTFIPQHPPEISAAAELSETPCGGRPVPRKTGGSLQNRLVVNLGFFMTPLSGSVVPKKHGLFPGVIAEGSATALSPQSRY